MSEEQGGVGAEVGARKISDGEVVQEEGIAQSGASKLSWAIFLTMLVLSGFGIWKIVEMVGVL